MAVGNADGLELVVGITDGVLLGKSLGDAEGSPEGITLGTLDGN